MATAPLTVDYDTIRRALALCVGWDRDTANWTTEQTADAEAIIKSGLRNAYYGHPHRWSFLEPMYDLTTTAPYDTGTVTVASGVVTGADGADWSGYSATLTDAWFILDGARYSIASYDGASQMTLDDTSLTDATASSYEIRFWRYTLPATFAGIEGELTFLPGETNEYHTVKRTSDHYIRELYQNDWLTPTDEPESYALVPKDHTATATQRWYLWIYPESQSAQKLRFKMRVNPENLDGTDKYPMGGPEFAEVVLEACLSQAELTLMDQPGVHTEKYNQLLQSAIMQDKQTAAPDYMDRLRDVTDPAYQDKLMGILSQGTATYVGYEHLM